MPRWLYLIIALGAVLALSGLGTCTYVNMNYRYVDSYELGYMFDSRTGQITVLPRTGWIRKDPIFQEIHTVDLRPMQVCMNANSRVLNCKLVRFNPAGLMLFLSWHGRADYTAYSASSSSSSSSGGSSGNLADILQSYAYDGTGRSYPFLTVMRELRNDDQAMTGAMASGAEGSTNAVATVPPQAPR